MDDTTLAIIGLAFGVWLAAGIWAVWSGLSMRARAASTLGRTARLARLLETAPAIPVIVRSDGKLEASPRLHRWLGLAREAQYLADLGSEDEGLPADDLKRLGEDVRAAQKTGKSFIRSVRAQHSDRTLLIKGRLADPQIYPNNACLLWIFDATDSEGQIARQREELRDARAAFESLAGIIEAAPIPMWHRSSDLRLSLVNSAYVAAVDARSAEEVVEKGIELIETVGGVTPIAAAGRAKEEGEPVARDLAVTLAGERRMVRAVDVPLGDAGVAGYALDIQDLENMRGEFRRFVEAQRNMLDDMSAAVAQFDYERNLVFSNLPFQRIFGMKPQWLADRPEFNRVLDRMREAGRLPEMRDFPSWRAERTRWFVDAEPAEENWVLPDGTHLRVLPQATPDGGLILLFEDRTEQVQLASARDTLLRVRTATFDNLFEAIAVFAADGKLNIWNSRFADLWQVEESELSKHPRIDDLMNGFADRLERPGEIDKVTQMVRGATAERRQRTGRITFADGRQYQFAAIPLPDGNALFTMLDVTDSARIERALRERNEALVEADSIKSRFLSNMSYEFRTPLTSIGGFAEMLAQGMGGDLPEQANEYVGAILESVERLSAEINTVLDFSQIEAGVLPIAKEKIDIGSLVHAQGVDARAKAEEAGIKLVIEVDQSAGSAAADPQRLGQAVEQILGNAIRYTDSGGRVLLRADGNKDHARIIVSDNGPGMDAAQQAQALGKPAKSGDAKGADRDSAIDGAVGGLGLPLARQLVEAQGGELILQSQPGKGTVITIELARA